MRKLTFSLAAVVFLALVVMGCGGGDTAEDTPIAATPAAETSAAETSAGETWTTVTTLRSSDPKERGILISQPFTATGEVQVILDMPGGGDTDGLIGIVLPEDEPISVEAGKAAESFTVMGLQPTQVISGLDGSFKIVITGESTKKAWSLEIQTRP